MVNKDNFHESLDRANVVESGSNRSFGIVFAVVFSLIALFPLINGAGIRVWALIIAVAFFGLAFIAPGLLKPLNLLWARFGALLHKIVTPIILGMIFFAVVTPMAIVFKILGKDPLRLRFEPNSTSYWIIRNSDDPEPQSMKNQF
jgi:Saxitoxin biosynthesis operon protein SxtJ